MMKWCWKIFSIWKTNGPSEFSVTFSSTSRRHRLFCFFLWLTKQQMKLTLTHEICAERVNCRCFTKNIHNKPTSKSFIQVFCEYYIQRSVQKMFLDEFITILIIVKINLSVAQSVFLYECYWRIFIENILKLYTDFCFTNNDRNIIVKNLSWLRSLYLCNIFLANQLDIHDLV